MSNPYAPPSGDRPTGPSRPSTPTGSPPEPGPAYVGPGHGGPEHGGPAQGDPVRGPGRPRVPVPVRPAPDPEAVRGASRQIMHFGLLFLATLLVSSLTLPWQAASVLFALATIVAGIRALRSVWAAGLRGALVPMLAVGIGAALMLTLATVGMVALWPIQMEHQKCVQSALTISATEQCESAYTSRLNDLRDRLVQRAG